MFDSIIINVGTCGDPRWAHYPGMPSGGKAQTNGSNEGKSYVDAIKSGQDAESSSEGEKHDGEEEVFEGPVIHSSKLDEVGLEGKTVLVVGSGASGVEAVETALAKGAQKAIIIARLVKRCACSCTKVLNHWPVLGVTRSESKQSCTYLAGW